MADWTGAPTTPWLFKISLLLGAGVSPVVLAPEEEGTGNNGPVNSEIEIYALVTINMVMKKITAP